MGAGVGFLEIGLSLRQRWSAGWMRHRRKKKDSQNNAARISLGLRVGLESIRAADNRGDP